MRNRSISVNGAMSLVCTSAVGVGVLAFPRLMVEDVNTGAIVMTAVGILIAALSSVVIVRLGLRFPQQNLIEYSELLIGKWLSRIGAVFISSFFAMLTALGAREFGEVVVTSVLLRTPIEVTIIVMAVLAVIGTRNEILTISYVSTLYLPIIIVPVVVILILSLQNLEPLYLQPWLGSFPRSPGRYVESIITIAALFQPSFIMTMVIPHMKEPSKALRATLYGLSLAGVVYLFTMMICLGVFGSGEVTKLLWPTLELAKLTSLPGGLLERLDALFLAVWVAAVFTTLMTTSFLAVRTVNQMLKLPEHKILAVAFLPLICALALLPRNVLQLYEIIRYIGYIGLLLTFGYPLLLYGMAILRRKRGDAA